MPRFESTSSRVRTFELCLKNRSIASLCRTVDESIVSGRSSAFLGVLFSIPSHEQHYYIENFLGKKNHEQNALLLSPRKQAKLRRALASENHQSFLFPEVKLTV